MSSSAVINSSPPRSWTIATDFTAGRRHPSISEVLKLALKHYKKGKIPVTGRPADYLEPEMESARDSVKAYSGDISDILTAALNRIDGTRFVRAKY